MNNLKDLTTLKVGDAVQYDSPTVINNHHWIWQGTVTRVTWKFVYIEWTHSNSPVFPGPIVETEKSIVNAFTRKACDMTITLINPPAPVPVVAPSAKYADSWPYGSNYAKAKAQINPPTPVPVYYYRKLKSTGGYKCAGHGAEDAAHRAFYLPFFKANQDNDSRFEADCILSEYKGDIINPPVPSAADREGQVRVAFNGDEWLFHNGQWELGTSYLAFNQ